MSDEKECKKCGKPVGSDQDICFDCRLPKGDGRSLDPEYRAAKYQQGRHITSDMWEQGAKG